MIIYFQNSYLKMIRNLDDLIVELESLISAAEKHGKTKVLLLTGGETIKILYRSFKWKQLLECFDLVSFADERLVKLENKDSNCGELIRTLGYTPLNLISPVDKKGELSDEFKELIHFLDLNKNICSICLTGFGLDGHVWSLFKYEDLLKNDVMLFNKSEIHKHRRLTLGKRIADKLSANLLFSTNEKWETLTKQYKRAPLFHLFLDIYII